MEKEKVKYAAKGQILFIQTKDGLKERTYDRDYYLNTPPASKLGIHANDYLDFMYNANFTFTIHRLIPGKKFLKMVLSGNFIDEDGSILEVFVDGFKSNLGIFTNKLISGEGCLLDEDTWKDVCNKHDVEVNWANK